jgi:hypothetical protein
MRDGVITEMSIGFDTITETFEKVGQMTVRHIKEAKLWDVSPVTFAANPTAEILDVKAAEQALKHQDYKPIEEAVKSLQALLKTVKDISEPLSTPDVLSDDEAAEMDSVLERIGESVEGLDAFNDDEAAAVLDAAISKYEKEN